MMNIYVNDGAECGVCKALGDYVAVFVYHNAEEKPRLEVCGNDKFYREWSDTGVKPLLDFDEYLPDQSSVLNIHISE